MRREEPEEQQVQEGGSARYVPVANDLQVQVRAATVHGHVRAGPGGLRVRGDVRVRRQLLDKDRDPCLNGEEVGIRTDYPEQRWDCLC